MTRVSYGACPMSYVLWHVSYVLCPFSWVPCPVSYVLCPVSRGVSAAQPAQFSKHVGRVRDGRRVGSPCRFGGSCRKTATLHVPCPVSQGAVL